LTSKANEKPRDIETGYLAKDAIILLVEDMADDAMMVLRAFDSAALGSKIFVLKDGEEAIHYLSAQGQYADRKLYPLPDMILLDLKMPKVDGFDVLKWIRNQPKFKDLVVVVLTLSSQIRDVNRAYQLGANSFMVKPDEFTNVAAMTKLLRDYWRLGNGAPGQIQRPDGRI
jgi:CheY-like chemotaxis protein